LRDLPPTLLRDWRAGKDILRIEDGVPRRPGEVIKDHPQSNSKNCVATFGDKFLD
jgi:hypothetical protein